MMLANLFARFAGDDRGAAAVIFGFSAFAMIGIAGFAVDFSRVHAVKSSAQSTIDAAMLAAARKSSIDEDGIEALLDSYFSRPGILKHSATYSGPRGSLRNSGNELDGEVRLRVPTVLLGVLGFGHIDVKVESRVMKGLGNVEIALVLDTTKSMEGSRLSSLKSASNELIDTLYALPGADRKVKVALVPFAQYVNVGMENRNASWMDVLPDSSNTTTSCYDTYPDATKSNCRMVNYTGYDDGVPYTYSVEECDWNYGTPVNVCAPYTTGSTWNGCAGARSSPLNIKDEQYSTRIPGVHNVSCPGKILPLSKNPSDIKTSINAMTAHGQTYIPTGLVWGWRTLSNRAPFTESAEDTDISGGAVRKYMVLMTDGENQRAPRYPQGDHEDNSASAKATANQLTRDACDEIKRDSDSKIEIYTIAFEVTDNSIKDILRYCATPGGAFFDAIDYGHLITAFSEIGASVNIARVAR